ncbi:MAG: hypothetical protein M1325_03805 [Actinobacteria bacterium]|nr:hypothetical protein [Actinomycetota bacterium]
MDPTLTELPLTPAMQKLLDERLAELRCDPDVGEPGEVVVVQLRQRLREGRADAVR